MQRRLDGFAKKPARTPDAPEELKVMLKQQISEREEAKRVISQRDKDYQMVRNETESSTLELDGQVMQSLQSMKKDMQYLQGLINEPQWTQEMMSSITERVFARIREAIAYVNTLGPQFDNPNLAAIIAQRAEIEDRLPAMRANYNEQLQKHEQLLIQHIKAKHG